MGKKYDFVFHLAAYNHVGDSFLHIHESLISNLISTANLLEFGPKFEKFIYTASSEVYGLQNEVPFKETDLPFPISPYAVGKYGGELYAPPYLPTAYGEIGKGKSVSLKGTSF